MKSDFIQAKPKMTQKDWEKLVAMSEKEIDDNANDDADNPPFSSYGSAHEMLSPDGKTIYFIPVDAAISNWMKEHNLQGYKIAATLLRQFVEAQSGIK